MNRKPLVALSLCCGLALAGCPAEESPPPASMPIPRVAGTSVAFDKVWSVGTHNSFWVERQGGDPYASGPRQRIADQLLADRARSLEFDIHRDATPHNFRVYHAVPGDSLCDTLQECLAMVRTFHRTLPEHQPLVVFIELKELFQGLFDGADYTPEDLDHILDSELGSLLYRPRDFMQPCAGLSDLTDCAQQVGWPSLADLKGRVMVAVLGNWDMFGGQNTAQFVTYATPADIRSRTGFPIVSTWQLDWTMLDSGVQQSVTQDQLLAADAQSIFVQALGPDDTMAYDRLAKGRVVRMDNAFSVDDQLKELAKNVQIIQTDTPWIHAGASDSDLPLQPLSPAVPIDTVREPGNRLPLVPSTTDSQSAVFAYEQIAGDATTQWETTVSVGASDLARVGCLRAAHELDPMSDNSVTLCRYLLPIDKGPSAVAQVLRLSICQASACTTFEYQSADETLGGSGEIMALTVKQQAGMSCVSAQSARLVDVSFQPLWTPLGDMHCLPATLPYQGLSRLGVPATAALDPVYFFNTTRDGQAVAPSDLKIQ